MEKERIRHCIVVGASAFIFLAFGVWEIVNPQYWVGFVPPILFSFNLTLLILIHGITITVLGLWILTGKWLRLASIIGTLAMLQIVISLVISSGFSDLFVRDFAIMLFILSLAFEENKYPLSTRTKK